MKNLLIVSGLLFLSSQALAQSIVEGATGPVKFSDVVAQHNKQLIFAGKEKTGIGPGSQKVNLPQESGEKDYHFDRWKWYWQQHLDQNGYLVSPVKTWNEWEKFTQNKAAARTTTTDYSSWTFVGTDSSGANGSGVGRINVIAFHPTDPNTYWIGSPGGGGWKTTNNGVTWTCMTDNLPLLSISDIKYNPLNPNTMYICTGDRDGDDYFSTGVIKSYDGGVTWHNTGLVWPISSMNLANSMVINPSDTNTLILGTTLGIYYSHDGGTTWTLSASSSGNNFKQVLYHPTDTNILYATSHLNSGTGAQGQIYRSADGGLTWSQVTSFTDAYRISLAVTPASPNIVKALVAASDATNQFGLSGIYNSTDSGLTFTEIYTGGCSGSQNLLSFNANGTGCGGQGFYDLPIAISPTNANNVYIGGVNAWRSTNGGSTWILMDQWSFSAHGVVTIHADKHFMGFQPTVSGRFFETNDGGIYWSDNPVSTGVWNDATNGLGITEFYRVAVSNVATYEIAGAQDVGTKFLQYGTFQDFDGGDGMECQLDPLDSNCAYSSSEYGSIDISTATSGSNISSNIPGTPTGGWVTPFVIEPSCHLCILAGYQDVYRSTDQGTTWTDISGALTSGDLLRVVTSYSDPNTYYAADDGSTNIWYTHTGAGPWTNINAPYSGAIISDIKVDQFDNTKIYVTFSGYGSPQVVTYSPSAGWTSFNTGLPDVPVNCIMIDTSNRVKYIGTDIGVFYRDTTMTAWAAFQHGMPVVRVNDLQIDYATNRIWAATYGRSLWESPRQVFYNPLALSPLAPDYFNIAPNPSNGSFDINLKNNSITGKSVIVSLINSVGNKVWQQELTVNETKVKVNTSNLAAGEYTLELAEGSNLLGFKKVIIY